MDTDTIVRTVTLNASRERVWKALTDSKSFGSWFGVDIDGPFVAGKEATGRIVPTTADPDVGRLQEPYRGFPWRVQIDRIEPMTLFSFRWHPFAIDKAVDYSGESMTLVTFELSEAPDGTRLTITESGFDGLPPGRREPAYRANSGGWEHQARLIGKYLAAGKDGKGS